MPSTVPSTPSATPRPFLRRIVALGAWLLLTAPGCGSTPAAPAAPTAATAPAAAAPDRGARPELNERFRGQDVDVAGFVELFEGESREIAVHRDALAATLELRPGTYTAVGSRKGYRDVRETFTVLPGRALPTVLVRCVEPI